MTMEFQEPFDDDSKLIFENMFLELCKIYRKNSRLYIVELENAAAVKSAAKAAGYSDEGAKRCAYNHNMLVLSGIKCTPS